MEFIERRSAIIWHDVETALGVDHPWWLELVRRAARDWQLDSKRAAWGYGMLFEEIPDRRSRRARSAGRREDLFMPAFELMNAQARVMQNVHRMAGVEPPEPPVPGPGMTKKEWQAEVARFGREGEEVRRRLNEKLGQTPRWKAQPRELRRDVGWFVERIRPGGITPPKIAVRDNMSYFAVEKAIRKVAKTPHLFGVASGDRFR